MAANYWIKLYTEILDDPKMATLPDRLWRRIVELFLLAGKLGKSGQVPDAKQIAWMLRTSTDDIILDMQQLEATGIVEPITNGWLIVNFEKRQAPAPASERMRQSRERTVQAQYYGSEACYESVTNRNTETETDTEQKQITETEQTPEAAIAGGGGTAAALAELTNVGRVYVSNIGRITPIIQEELANLIGKYSGPSVIDAIGIAKKNGKPTLNYIAGILRKRADEDRQRPKRIDYSAFVER